MKYYLIAGERSGDLHGSNLIEGIKKYDVDAEFRAWGGEQMQQAGATLVTHYGQMAFMGFWEVLKNYFTIAAFLKKCKVDIVDYQPDVVILIDYAGFNMRIAKFAKLQGFKTFYYISPRFGLGIRTGLWTSNVILISFMLFFLLKNLSSKSLITKYNMLAIPC